MVAVIKWGNAIRRAFHYNENKVDQGVATLLMAQNYPMDMEAMQEGHRINMLQKIADRGQNVKLKSTHISLNFSPRDVLDPGKIKRITGDYMQAIGFGDQPYLVYQHFDAGHPHVHIVTTKVRTDGTRIETNNIGKKVSQPATERLEEKYGLIKAKDHKRDLFQLKAVALKKVEYGKVETKQAMSNVLDFVLEKYKYTSLHQLNAVLELYNIRAEDGNQNSRTKKYKGLTYRLLDDNQNPIGVRVKASLFYQKPTLKYLEEKFVSNKPVDGKNKLKLKNEIDLAFVRNPGLDKDQLTAVLKKQGIDLVLRHTKDQKIYGVTFIDHRSRSVFNGSDLDKKRYSANALQARFETNAKNPVKPKLHGHVVAGRKGFPGKAPLSNGAPADYPQNEFHKRLFEIVFQSEFTTGGLPAALTGKRKRKRRRRYQFSR
jgi:hypothetical protein